MRRNRRRRSPGHLDYILCRRSLGGLHTPAVLVPVKEKPCDTAAAPQPAVLTSKARRVSVPCAQEPQRANLPFSMPSYTPRSLSNLRSAGVDELVAAAPIAESKLALNAGASVLAVNESAQRDELLAEVELLRVSFASRLQCCIFWDVDVLAGR